MPVIVVDPERPDPSVIRAAAARIVGGELVAFPTETVYGLGAAALNPGAVAKIYAAKGRPSYNPLIVHVLSPEAAQALVTEWPPLAAELTDQFWPGPLTIVLGKRPLVPDLVTAGLPSVAVRAPAHPVARALLEAAGVPIAAPSANRFQAISPTSAAHVARSLGPDAALILDAGPTRVGIESTVVDLSGAQPALLRLGGLALAELEAVTGPLARPAAPDKAAPRSSPGLVGRHYAPSGELRVVEAGQIEAAVVGAGPVGLISFAEQAPAGVDHHLSMPADPREYGRLLYAALHTLDELGCARILVEAVPNEGAWAAIRDRLARSAVRA
ncbi:TsaC protein (YrdC-Sua5 domains) required for threonylcarbamoyladenosine t(6)A37 modification in tRNA [Enhygromyxa salina]|uniref:Threonylcarbamoyl-AMP synthase n=1 Tax=Enhygromyxa salina TaxID=215803 RepID=A0A0C2CZ70_9BACT|nr:L-threonylcarbamoyladenylate synthase [Enhygromyxa salina]KIG14940.1 TsaC protein (YrdC-Sua5 domains) required for threonylcarbamoyladenosine t(6)A37 modification in tRNA [Enhygromyxa salina]